MGHTYNNRSLELTMEIKRTIGGKIDVILWSYATKSFEYSCFCREPLTCGNVI